MKEVNSSIDDCSQFATLWLIRAFNAIGCYVKLVTQLLLEPAVVMAVAPLLVRKLYY